MREKKWIHRTCLFIAALVLSLAQDMPKKKGGEGF